MNQLNKTKQNIKPFGNITEDHSDDPIAWNHTSSKIKHICNRLGDIYKRDYGKELIGFDYYNNKNTGKFVCLLSRGLLMQVSDKDFKKYVLKYEDHKVLKVKCITVAEAIVLVIQEKDIKKNFKAQVSFLTKCIETISAPFIYLDSARKVVNQLASKQGKLLIVDLLSLMLHLREGFFSATTIISCLMQMYTIHTRYMDLFGWCEFRAQAGANVTDLLVGFGLLGVPKNVLESMKTFTSLTGKRIFESEFAMDVGEKLFESLIVMVEWIANPIGTLRLLNDESVKYIVGVIRKLGSSVFLHRDIKQICDIYSRYVSNPQSLFDPTFRQEIMTKHAAMKADNNFLDYIHNGSNKYFLTTWNLFESNVVKSCQAFDTSGREEPLCIVFEGNAGAGKSNIMNQFVALLKESGKTTICHSVPAAEDGKDFYDDYENQEVFVMDDVGQQGKSQWRYLINYVSPVKYPLPCAAASKKNTKFFNSKVILCTTNHFMDLGGFTSTDCISEPEALYRRAHVIKIERGDSAHFSQRFSYYKYDHINSKQWENKFINHNALNIPEGLSANFSTEQEYRPDNMKRSLVWLYKLYMHLVASNKADAGNMVANTATLRSILEECDEVYDDTVESGEFEAQCVSFACVMAHLFGLCKSKIIDYVKIFQEYISYYISIAMEVITDAAGMIMNFVTDFVPTLKDGCDRVLDFMSTSRLFQGILASCVTGFLVKWFFGENEVVIPTPAFSESTVKDLKKFKAKHEMWGAQSGILEKEHTEWIQTVKKGCKTIKIKNGLDYGEDNLMQCIVSGKRIMVPAHLEIGDKFVDLYHSWEHYKNEHVEIENVQLKLIKMYMSCDLAIYEIKGTVPLYKLNHAIFSGSATCSSNWYLINSAGHLPVVYDVDVRNNDEPVKYATVCGKYEHSANTGFYTPYSAGGACGTVLAAPGAGILGFHVAGGPNAGFCVRPNDDIMTEIRSLMLGAPCANNFELDDKIIPNFSGVRVRYEGEIDQRRANGDTVYKPSVFHREVNQDVEQLIKFVEWEDKIWYFDPEKGCRDDSIKVTTTPVDVIDRKTPPNFASRGTPAKTLKELSKKTFMKQGRILPAEIEFMKAYLRTIMTKFDDLTDDETAFGGEHVPSLNKDSSNGYGCEKGKDYYFDFANRRIKDTGKELIEAVRLAGYKEEYDYNLFMCRETFKDELRKSSKVDDPRTFRVMPLGHIWWTKKVFGKLLKHFKETRMETGISVGYNPYIDAHELALRLKECVVTGDADFGKWDGTVLACIIRLITEVFSEFYEGSYSYMIPWLTNTIANSFVLVNDEIWATTHGLPSGTWLTLLLNCLLNKCLTALVIYRHKPDPRPEDVHRVLDFVTGDDKVFGVDKEMSEYFNLINLKKVTEELGMDCTNGDKTEITKPSQEFKKLTYVKRHFRQHPILRRYVGVLSMDTILNTIQWSKSDVEDTHEAMLGKMRSMQVEAYLHSPVFFTKITNIFKKSYPYDQLFTENKVIDILCREDGYEQSQVMQNKFYQY